MSTFTGFNVETPASNNGSTKAKAPAFLNISLDVGTDSEGKAITIPMPFGIAIDPTGKSYGNNARRHKLQKQFMEHLIELAKENGGVTEFQLTATCEVRLTEQPEQEEVQITWNM